MAFTKKNEIWFFQFFNNTKQKNIFETLKASVFVQTQHTLNVIKTMLD